MSKVLTKSVVPASCRPPVMQDTRGAVAVIVAHSEGSLLSESELSARQQKLEATPLAQHPKDETLETSP